jgi:hypothetical protein
MLGINGINLADQVDGGRPTTIKGLLQTCLLTII